MFSRIRRNHKRQTDDAAFAAARGNGRIPQNAYKTGIRILSPIVLELCGVKAAQDIFLKAKFPHGHMMALSVMHDPQEALIQLSRVPLVVGHQVVALGMHGDGVGVEGPVGVNVNMRGDGQPFPIFIMIGMDGDEVAPHRGVEQVFVAAEKRENTAREWEKLSPFSYRLRLKNPYSVSRNSMVTARPKKESRTIGGQRFLDPFAVAGDGVFQIGKPLDFPLNCLHAVLQDLLPLGKMILVDVFVNLF